MGFDLSDAAAAGTSLDDLIDAARTLHPTSVDGLAAQARLADDGVGLLEALDKKLYALQDKAARTEAVAVVLQNDQALFALANAWQIRNGDVEALIAKVKAHPGASAPGQKLLGVVKRQHAALAKEKAGRMKQRVMDEGDQAFKNLARSLGLPSGIESPAGYEISRDRIPYLPVLAATYGSSHGGGAVVDDQGGEMAARFCDTCGAVLLCPDAAQLTAAYDPDCR